MDKYKELRDAIDAGPTPGPWKEHSYTGQWAVINVTDGVFKNIALVPAGEADARLIAACNSETIRALLAERDALRQSLLWCAGALQAAVPDNNVFSLSCGQKTAGQILDEAVSVMNMSDEQQLEMAVGIIFRNIESLMYPNQVRAAAAEIIAELDRDKQS